MDRDLPQENCARRGGYFNFDIRKMLKNDDPERLALRARLKEQ
jgi:hypothetical protein